MADPTTAWINALAFLAGYGAAELQHRIRKHLRSMGPPRGSYGPPHPTGGRVVDMHGRTIGYQPRSQCGPTNPPPEEP